MFYYKKAKKNGWKPSTYILKIQIDRSLKFEYEYSYFDLILKLIEYLQWKLPIKIQIIQNYEGQQKDVTYDFIDKVINQYDMMKN